MRSGRLFSSIAALVFGLGLGVARADDSGDDKTLPDQASATAHANAFGQQGARMKALHQAAHDAAVADARHAAGRPDSPGAAVDDHGDNQSSHSDAGRARAAAAAAAGQARAADARATHAPDSHANAHATSRP